MNMSQAMLAAGKGLKGDSVDKGPSKQLAEAFGFNNPNYADWQLKVKFVQDVEEPLEKKRKTLAADIPDHTHERIFHVSAWALAKHSEYFRQDFKLPLNTYV